MMGNVITLVLKFLSLTWADTSGKAPFPLYPIKNLISVAAPAGRATAIHNFLLSRFHASALLYPIKMSNAMRTTQAANT